MSVLFQDDFEGGNLSNWTGTNGTIAASGAAAHAGSFGCDANSSDAFAFKDFSAPASQFVSHRADVKLVTASGPGLFRILQISQGSTSIAKIIYDNGAYKLELRNADNTLQTATIAGIVANTWQELRIDYDWSVGQAFVARAYVDGVQAAELIDATPAGGSIWQATRVFILTFEDTGPTSAHAYFDDVTVEDTTPAGGATYDEAGGATGAGVGSGQDAFTASEGASSSGGALTPSALDTLDMTDVGAGVAVLALSGQDTMAAETGGQRILELAARQRICVLAARRRTLEVV